MIIWFVNSAFIVVELILSLLKISFFMFWEYGNPV